MTGFTDNTADSRFEYHIDDSFALANYRVEDDVLHIDYVEAPQKLRGTGAAGKLMQAIVDHARAEGVKVKPVCGYAVSWMTRRPECHDVMV